MDYTSTAEPKLYADPPGYGDSGSQSHSPRVEISNNLTGSSSIMYHSLQSLEPASEP